MKTIKSTMLLAISATLLLAGCCGDACKTKETETTKTITMNKVAPYVKKYTNADYYKDGKLQADVVFKAYEEMLAHYGITMSKFMRDNIWITDFNLGDFENVGMAGLFWVNNPTSKYFGHDIYLLPNQMIAEHRHVPTEGFDAKNEAWVVRNGMCYNYSIGEPTPNGPALPESHVGISQAPAFVIQNEGDVVELKELLTPHYLRAGDGGAVVVEFASYHDGAGLRFTNENVEFIDILTAE